MAVWHLSIWYIKITCGRIKREGIYLLCDLRIILHYVGFYYLITSLIHKTVSQKYEKFHVSCSMQTIVCRPIISYLARLRILFTYCRCHHLIKKIEQFSCLHQLIQLEYCGGNNLYLQRMCITYIAFLVTKTLQKMKHSHSQNQKNLRSFKFRVAKITWWGIYLFQKLSSKWVCIFEKLYYYQN